MKNVRNLSATEAHAVRIEELRELLAKLEAKVETKASLENVHWGHVGDLGHMIEQLENVVK